LGDVTSKIDGKWQEFRIAANRDSPAKGCTSGCSSASSSEPLGSNNSPFTYTSDSCTVLEVMEGYDAGNAYYDVYDKGTLLFTVKGYESGAYETDPVKVKQDSNFGRGEKKLAKGDHSIEIKTNWLDQDLKDGGAGWLRITTVPCDCLKRQEWCTPGAAKKCCSGLICRLKAGDDVDGPKQCLPCVAKSKRCYQDSDCCKNRKCRRSGQIKVCK
jgi:hypothetical protein